jgi:integrase
VKKRGNGEGTIYKRKDGRWEASYFLDTPEGPKKRCIYGKTRKAVAEKLAAAIADRDRGLVFDSKGATVEEFLRRWLKDAVKPGSAHRTHAAHRQQVETHIIPGIGRLKLSALRKHHVDRLYADLLREKPHGPGLAPSTVRRIHAVLHRALEEAVKGDLIYRNPAAHANKPKVRQKEIEPLDAG